MAGTALAVVTVINLIYRGFYMNCPPMSSPFMILTYISFYGIAIYGKKEKSIKANLGFAIAILLITISLIGEFVYRAKYPELIGVKRPYFR